MKYIQNLNLKLITEKTTVKKINKIEVSIIKEDTITENIGKDLPQLIVALDKEGNYIHIRDVKDATDYYCPCCGGIVRPRAYKKDKDYIMQPHFYHISGGCSEETRIHWLYKNWLFKKGSSFYINDVLYEVDNIELEKTYKTSFGDYRPDLTINLTNGMIMFFEINFTSAKTENNYFCKWDELHNDVVEVNIKKLINEDFNHKIPKFSLVYSDGVCYKKQYQARDEYASVIGLRKLDWKRQDKINYKIQWEKLDWFWICLTKYRNKKIGIGEVINSFSEMSFKDMDTCLQLIKKIKCVDVYDNCTPIINECFYKIIAKDIEKYDIKLEQRSPRRFMISWKVYVMGTVSYYETYELRKGVKYYDEKLIKLIRHEIKMFESNLNNHINDLHKFPYYNLIFQLYEHKNLKNNVTCDIYFEGNVYINGKYCKIYSTDRLKSYIAKYDFKYISQHQKLKKEKQLKADFIMYSKLKWIINRINTSKNKFWNCEYCRFDYDTKGCMYDIFLSSKEYYSISETIYFKGSDSKYKIYKKIKNSMNYIIKKEREDYIILRKNASSKV